MISIRRCVLLLMFIFLYGCGKSNESAITLDVSGKHPVGWAIATGGGMHPSLFMASPDKCRECHGSDLRGGISKVTCFNPGRSGISCHASGPVAHTLPFSGASHSLFISNSTDPFVTFNSCTSCHSSLGIAGPYPAASGTPPHCTGCHTGWATTGNRGCAACHGDISTGTGRPNGTSFPDNAGLHTSVDWHVVDCAVCHTGGGSGALSHGNSNRIVKTNADVTIAFTNGTSAAIVYPGMSFTRTANIVSCNGKCHSKRNGGQAYTHSDSPWQ